MSVFADTAPDGMSMRPNVFADSPWDFEAELARIRGRGIADPASARELGATVYELAPGASGFFLHADSVNQELFVVLSGRPTLRTEDADRELRPGDVVSRPPEGRETDTLANLSGETARVLAVSTPRFTDVA
jgi:uncharacterized cupin superfamily protein